MQLLRNVLAASAAIVLLVALSAQADAASQKAIRHVESTKAGKKNEPPKLPFDGQAKGTLQIVVSIANQRLSLYSNGIRIAGAGVSTGKAEKPTPTGVFSVIEKDRFHRSNLYDDAPMYYMHRLTWSGVAMHEGILPGIPASHGCIRLPTEFVSKLWQVSKLGLRVVVAYSDVAPHELDHPNLFVPREKPADIPGSASLGIEGLRPTLAAADHNVRPIRLAQGAPDTRNGGNPFDLTDAPRDASSKASELVPPEGAFDIPLPPPPAPPIEAADMSTPPAADVDSTATVKAQATKPSEPPPAVAKTQKSAAPVTAPDLLFSTSEPRKSAPDGAVDPPKPPAPKGRSHTEPTKHAGQVAVFVSRKEKKVFVRQGFAPLFDMPVEIAYPDQPLGTHVFTALALREDGSGMRWNAISMPGEQSRHSDHRDYDNDNKRKSGKRSELAPNPAVETRSLPSAMQALDRVHLPQAAIDRIGELLVPGSSLIISDAGLGSETGRYTEFVVLTK